MGREDFSQAGYGVRFEWGASGAKRLAPAVRCLVIVDVLSFSTSVSVAVESGSRVFPYAWRDESATAFARQMDARLAVGRRAVSAASPWSLSPAALRRAPRAQRLVLPSPGGSAIAASAGNVTVAAGSLLNPAAVGRWLTGRGEGTPEHPVGVIAAGEQWPDGSLRPALEDLLGAGAVIAALRAGSGTDLSPEAAAAAAAFVSAVDVGEAVASSSSGRELADGGYAEDVAVATELDASSVVPVLTHGAFVAAR
ncbi:2-phosphosulfolactate phosphatase [Streptomyces sp. NPDC017940]|uniref:2-phosphosulfolactate phosphatase n=1 Tax=Streptomyces sp. NPDC017940 TaxID=3365017 RepID=UPI003799418C